MTVLSASKIEQISQAKDPKAAIFAAVGDLTRERVASDLVLLGTYIRNEKTSGGIIRPTEVLEEDEYQGKVGLVLKTGPLAYGDWEDDEHKGENAVQGTWVVYQIKTLAGADQRHRMPAGPIRQNPHGYFQPRDGVLMPRLSHHQSGPLSIRLRSRCRPIRSRSSCRKTIAAISRLILRRRRPKRR